MNKPIFQRRHYEVVAAVLAELPEYLRYNPADSFIKRFEKDNPKFDRQRFLNAVMEDMNRE